LAVHIIVSVMHGHMNIKTDTQLTCLPTSLQTVATLKNVAKNVRQCVCSTPSARTKSDKMDGQRMRCPQNSLCYV